MTPRNDPPHQTSHRRLYRTGRLWRDTAENTATMGEWGMKEAPERIWVCMEGPMVGLFVSGGDAWGWPEYTRSDLCIPRAEHDRQIADFTAALAEREAQVFRLLEMQADQDVEIENGPLKLADAHEIIGELLLDLPWQEQAARWHEAQAVSVMGGLSCGSENGDFRAAGRLSDQHSAFAAELRRMK